MVAGGSVATETAVRVYRDLQELPVDFHLSTGVLGVAASRVAVQRFGELRAVTTPTETRTAPEPGS